MMIAWLNQGASLGLALRSAVRPAVRFFRPAGLLAPPAGGFRPASPGAGLVHFGGPAPRQEFHLRPG